MSLLPKWAADIYIVPLMGWVQNFWAAIDVTPTDLVIFTKGTRWARENQLQVGAIYNSTSRGEKTPVTHL